METGFCNAGMVLLTPGLLRHVYNNSVDLYVDLEIKCGSGDKNNPMTL